MFLLAYISDFSVLASESEVLEDVNRKLGLTYRIIVHNVKYIKKAKGNGYSRISEIVIYIIISMNISIIRFLFY
jgi:hypothetical protein